MRRLILLAAVAALFLVALPVASAVAAPPEQVTFGGDALFSGTGDFKASTSSAICAYGTTHDLDAKEHATPNGLNLQVVKEFNCGDGSGTFQLKLQVRIPTNQLSTFHWVVVGGTDDYEDLKGNGSGYATESILDPDPPYGVIGVVDYYEGKFH